MIYRNGWREFFIMLVSFGTPMSVFFMIQYGVIAGLIGGIAAGVLFAGVMTLFVRITEKKFNKLRAEIAAERRIICDGGATWQGEGGWMFFTEAGLEFYPHKLNHAHKEFAIPTEELKEVAVNRTQIVVKLKNGSAVTVVVSHAKDWKAQIEAVVSASDGTRNSGDYSL